jgi:isocitrate dehydrogenase
MKMSDGLFHKVFDEVAAQYPDIGNEHWIVDIGAAKLADTPEAFDVIVMPNLYGDILSDVAAQIARSVGLAGSANIGDHCAMFEAIHGSAPRRAGQNLANPSGLLMGAVMMLVHIDQPDAAARVHNAWLRTIEDGIHTYDVHTPGVSREKVGTREFAGAVIARLGQRPCTLKAVSYQHAGERRLGADAVTRRPAPKREIAGVDIYVEWPSRDPKRLVEALRALEGGGLSLTMISNRGVKVWPEGQPETFCTDSFRCRFTGRAGAVTQQQIIDLAGRIAGTGIEIAITETLRNFDGRPGYSLAQGE